MRLLTGCSSRSTSSQQISRPSPVSCCWGPHFIHGGRHVSHFWAGKRRLLQLSPLEPPHPAIWPFVLTLPGLSLTPSSFLYPRAALPPPCLLLFVCSAAFACDLAFVPGPACTPVGGVTQTSAFTMLSLY